jgi:hypothetical protein
MRSKQLHDQRYILFFSAHCCRRYCRPMVWCVLTFSFFTRVFFCPLLSSVLLTDGVVCFSAHSPFSHPCLTPCSHTDRPTDTPLFIMEEQSSCYMRGCCGPAQPALVKFHNVSFGGERQEKKCCCIVLQPKRKMYNKAGAAVMTMEKAGMCGNCAQFGPTNCWVCFSMCQSEAWMHSGDIPSTYSPQGCACFKSKTNQITKSHCVQVVCSY